MLIRWLEEGEAGRSGRNVSQSVFLEDGRCSVYGMVWVRVRVGVSVSVSNYGRIE
jgi:hypothetical protein